jgi:hypothetical protein
MIASPPIALVYMGSYYDEGRTHTTYIWMLINTSMGAFIKCGYRFEVEMDDFFSSKVTLYLRTKENSAW